MTKKYNEKDLINNEQHIYDCFSNTTAFLGLDRVEVSIKGEIKFDATKLQIFSKKNKRLTVIKYIDSRYEYIRINNSTFGLLEIKLNPYDNSLVSHVQINHGGLNFETNSLSSFKEKLHNFLNFVECNAGITIYPSSIEYRELELAFTFATNRQIHIQTRALLLRSLSNNVNITIINDENQGILKAGKYKNEKHIFYDKIKKAKRNKQIPEELCHDIDVYRYEITLNKQKINYLFSSTNINSIDETDIINYFKGKVQKGIENLTKQINISIKKTQKALEEARTIQRHPYNATNTFFARLINDPLNSFQPMTLDEEIFCYLKLKQNFVSASNIARTKKRLIEHSFKHSRGFGENYFLSEMITWQTLRILKLMLDSTDFCKTYGLGCQLSKNNSKPKCLVFNNYTEEERGTILYQNIKSFKKNKIMDIHEIISKRLANLPTEIENSNHDVKYFSVV